MYELAPERGSVTGNNSPYSSGATVSLTAVANSGFEFVAWLNGNGDEVSNTPNYVFTITSNTELYVVFAVQQVRYNLSANILPLGADSVCVVEGTGTKLAEENPVITAIPANPYVFDHWELDGVTVAYTPSYTVANIQSDLNYTAIFRYIPQDRTITVASNDPSYGTVKIESSYYHTTSNTSLAIVEVVDEATLTATPNSGYQFDGWYYNNEKVSSNEVYTFTLPEHSTDRTYTANFIEVQA
jgi:uncharacterized repeat protein (TIGR02543 family)